MEQIIKADYAQAVKAIKQAIVVCRYRAARQMNGEVLGLYYSIGKYISEQSRNAQWGTNAIQTISDQLQQELPGLKGFSEENIRRMRKFYEEWAPVFEIRSAVSNEINSVPQSAEIQPFKFRATLLTKLGVEDIRLFSGLGFSLHCEIIRRVDVID